MVDVAEDDIEEEVPEKSAPKKPDPQSAPAWIVTFADLTTLMLTFFVLLLSFANMEVMQMEQFMGSANEAFGSQTEVHGDFQLVAPEGSEVNKSGNKRGVADPERVKKRQLAQMLGDAVRRENMADSVQIFMGEDGLSVRIDDSIAFNSGKANLKPQIVKFIGNVAKIMRSFDFNLLIEGHTDSIPIRTRRFPSNWELSTVRATTVLRKLLEEGVAPDRVAAVGYADRKPIIDQKTAKHRAENRRVEFKFIKRDD